MRDDHKALLDAPHLGISYTIILGGSLFLGVKADEKFGTKPYGALLGAAFGAVAGFYFLYREVYTKREEAEQKREEPPKDEDSQSE